MGQKNKIAAFTITESIMAMLLIVIVFGIGFMTFERVTSSNNIAAQEQAMLAMEMVLEQAITNNKLKEEGNIPIHGVFIAKSVQRNPLHNACFTVHLQAKNALGQQLGDLKKVYCEE